MLTLTGGRYGCARVFDFGEYGSYDYYYEIRLDREADRMQAAGNIQARSLRLPEITGVSDQLVEMMMPTGPQEMRSFAQTNFSAARVGSVPVRVSGRYTPLDGDETQDWLCCATNQIRTSAIRIVRAEGLRLSLEYQTVIAGIQPPKIPDEALLG